MSDYTDEEIRMKVLPLAVELVNNEVQRVMQRCNTVTLAELTLELVNIIKYGTVKAPDIIAATEATQTPVEPQQQRYA